MKKAKYIITIDGPAASGKTSVSRKLAERHGWAWVSTGAFYRGLAYIATREGVSLEDESALAKLCNSKVWRVEMAAEKTLVFLRDEDVTTQIYLEENGSAASFISRYPKVRENLLQAQRNLATGVVGLVAEGRDCGTVVFPNADLKIYITAGSANRAERRAKEEGKNIEEMRLAQVLRDLQDSSRQAAPMQIPENAHVIDTTSLNLEGVVEILDALVRKELEISK
jgi:CMP/dCMP kinase